MNIEDIKREFPEMPEEIRNMVKEQVDALVQIDEVYENSSRLRGRNKKYRRNQRRVIAALAAALILGTTAMAGSFVYQMYMERVGKYGVKVSVEQNTEVQTQTEQVPVVSQSEVKIFENPTVQATWIPKGMVEADNGYRFHMEGDYGSSGITIALWDAKGFKMTDTFIKDTEKMSVSGHDAVYIIRQGNTKVNEYNHGMYIHYPEAGMVVQLFLASTVSKEDAIYFAEGLKVVEKASDDPVRLEKADPEEEIYIRTMNQNISAEEMGEIFEIGETIVLPYIFSKDGLTENNSELTVKVSEVKMLDNISQLDMDCMQSELFEQIDAEGKLLPKTYQYIKRGDGIYTLDEVLYTEAIEQKMIYVVLEYSNTGEGVLEDILYSACLMKIQEKDGMYSVYMREKPEYLHEYDTISSSFKADNGNMVYWKVLDQESNDRNYIERLEPEETVTVHMGFLVNADELGYLYLSPGGETAYEFTELAIKTGFVDISKEVK